MRVFYALIVAAMLAACARPAPTVDIAPYVEATLTALATTAEAEEATATPKPTTTPYPTATPNPYEQIPPRGAYQHGYEVTEEFDRFTEVTNVTLGEAFDRVWNRVQAEEPARSLHVVYSYEGTTPAVPPVVLLAFMLTPKCDTVRFLLDDGIHMNPTTTYEEGAEAVCVRLTSREFLQIVNSNKVEVRLCSDEFALTSEQMEALRDVASRIQE